MRHTYYPDPANALFVRMCVYRGCGTQLSTYTYSFTSVRNYLRLRWLTACVAYNLAQVAAA